MRCIKCKKKIPDKSKFCNYCGVKQERQQLYRRSDGLFEKIMKINGKRVAFRAKTEDGVFEKILNYQDKQEKGLTFEEAAEMWYDEHWETLSPTTQKGYVCAYKEVKKYFGKRYIKQITHKDINQYIKQLPDSYARKTCLTRLQLINMIFKCAITNDLCEINPCEYATIPKKHGSKRRRAPTNDEIEIIKKSIDIKYNSFPVGFLAVLITFVGLRKGEALALQYKDIDRKSGRILITKSVYFEHNEGKIKKPKTVAGEREVIVPDVLLPFFNRGKPRDYVFSPTPDKPVRDHIFRAAWNYWQENTGLDLTAHQLRHGCATLLLEAELEAKDIQEQLGHADISTTLNIYTEVSENRKKKTQSIINNYIH